MHLAKPHMDIGLFTNRREEQLAFWQQTVGLAYDHLGKLGGGMQQLRHHMNGSILKVNHARDPLKPAPASGIAQCDAPGFQTLLSATAPQPSGGGGGTPPAAGTGTVRLHYHRPDGVFTGWQLYVWNAPGEALGGWPGRNPNLGPLRTAPYYAVQVVPGDIGAAVGLQTDERARVLDGQGVAIAGLYAVGNDAQSIMGGTYPGPGITLGPGMVFGYLAARDALSRAAARSAAAAST